MSENDVERAYRLRNRRRQKPNPAIGYFASASMLYAGCTAGFKLVDWAISGAGGGPVIAWAVMFWLVVMTAGLYYQQEDRRK